jgi:RNA polymerase sigma-70 factor (ECF subfamily)
MAKPIASVTPVAPRDSVVGLRSSAFLHDLRNGEREAFVRFFELYRGVIYNLVLRLTRGRGDATAITLEVLVRAYREILLTTGAIDLRPWIYRVALDTCREHMTAGHGAETATELPHDWLAASDPSRQTDLARRFREALASLTDLSYAALLLNDVHGLRHEETAAVLGVSTEAARTLLFRAGETFRGTFEQLSSELGIGACRLAEQAAASAVGRALPDDELRKLHAHARYCRPCRKTMAAWGTGGIGLALFLGNAPLPDLLRTVPIFGGATAAVLGGQAGTAAAAGAGAVTRALVRVRAVVSSKATAYAVAAVCLALAIVLGIYVSQFKPGQILLFTVRPSAPVASIPSRAPGKSVVARHGRPKEVAKPASPVVQHAVVALVATSAHVSTAVESGITHSGGGSPTRSVPNAAGGTTASGHATPGSAAPTVGPQSGGGASILSSHSGGSAFILGAHSGVGAFMFLPHAGGDLHAGAAKPHRESRQRPGSHPARHAQRRGHAHRAWGRARTTTNATRSSHTKHGHGHRDSGRARGRRHGRPHGRKAKKHHH